MNKGELRNEVQTRLAEDTTNPVFWSDADVDEAINDGYEEMSDVAEWYERGANIPLLSQVRYYDLRTALGGDTFLSPRRCFNPLTNWWLKPSEPRDMDFHTYRRWEINLGMPQKIFMRGLFYLGIFPLQNGDTGLMRFYYTAMPPALVNDSDEPGFPSEFQRGLVQYALFDLYAQDRETQKAMIHWQQYIEIEQQFVDYVQHRIGIDRLDSLHENSVLNQR